MRAEERSPAERLRHELAAARRRGEPFEEAWRSAVRVSLDGAPRANEWIIAFEFTRAAWNTAYHRRGRTPLADAMDALGLAEVVSDDVRVPVDSRLVA